MEIYIDRRTREELPDRFEDIIMEAVKHTLALTNASGCYEVSVSVVEADEIRDINKRFRNIDRETDVLSFPLIDFSASESAGTQKTGIEGEELDSLGDIIISIGRVFSQAEQYGHSPEREIGFLTAHGMLHLLGYDHMTPEDEKIMFSLQEKIMNAAGLFLYSS